MKMMLPDVIGHENQSQHYQRASIEIYKHV